MRAVLDAVGYDQMDELGSRSVLDAVAWLRSAPKPPPAALVRWEDRELPTEIGALRARVYWPEGEGPHPVLMNFHGGGWVTGSVEGDDLRCQRLAAGAGCIVVSVDYRMAPEHPFPQPLEDCRAATAWAHRHAAGIGGDGSRIAVSGASAGGNLAAAVSALARDARAGWLVAQLLFYPVMDATTREPGPGGGPWYLTRASMDWYWARYLAGADGSDPRASPGLAGDFSDLPQTLVITAQLDPLAAEARAYVAKLQAAGVKAAHREVEGVVHGFPSLAPHMGRTVQAMDEAIRFLQGAFRP